MRVPQDRMNGMIGAIAPGYAREVDAPLIVTYDVFVVALLRSRYMDRYVRIDLPPFIPADARRAAAAGVPATVWGSSALHVFVRPDVYQRVNFPPAPRTPPR
jgi:hypothetical protein